MNRTRYIAYAVRGDYELIIGIWMKPELAKKGAADYARQLPENVKQNTRTEVWKAELSPLRSR